MTAHPATVDVLLGHGDGTFASAAYGPLLWTTSLSLALADFNGDGNIDVAAATGTVRFSWATATARCRQPSDFGTSGGRGRADVTSTAADLQRRR